MSNTKTSEALESSAAKIAENAIKRAEKHMDEQEKQAEPNRPTNAPAGLTVQDVLIRIDKILDSNSHIQMTLEA